MNKINLSGSLVCLVLALLCIGNIYAEQNKNDSSTVANKELKYMKGRVNYIDPLGSFIKIKTGIFSEYKLMTNSETKVRVGDISYDVLDLNRGDKVIITYIDDGKTKLAIDIVCVASLKNQGDK